MKIKCKKSGEEGQASDFNVMSLSEIMVCFDDWMDTDFPSNYLFWLETEQQWVEFKHPRIIPDNYHRWFGEAKEQADLDRGYFE